MKYAYPLIFAAIAISCFAAPGLDEPMQPLVQASAPSAAPTIIGPTEPIEAGTVAWLQVSSGDGYEINIKPNKRLDMDPSRIVPGNAMFWSDEPGEYQIEGLAINWEDRRFAFLDYTVTVEGEQSPDPPGPGPGPGPDPPPVPEGKPFVFLLSESLQKSPAEATVQTTLRRHLEHQDILFRFLDPDTKTLEDWGERFKAEATAEGLIPPVLMVTVLPELPGTNGKLDFSSPAFVAVEPLPMDPAKAVSIVTEALE